MDGAASAPHPAISGRWAGRAWPSSDHFFLALPPLPPLASAGTGAGSAAFCTPRALATCRTQERRESVESSPVARSPSAHAPQAGRASRPCHPDSGWTAGQVRTSAASAARSSRRPQGGAAQGPARQPGTPPARAPHQHEAHAARQVVQAAHERGVEAEDGGGHQRLQHLLGSKGRVGPQGGGQQRRAWRCGLGGGAWALEQRRQQRHGQRQPAAPARYCGAVQAPAAVPAHSPCPVR